MHTPLKILAFAGSTRKESLNKKLALLAADLVETAGCGALHPEREVRATWIDLKDFPIPLYDGDYEERFGLPAAVLNLRALLRQHDALIVASPEYNGFPSPLLKNALDWVSRPFGDEPRHAVFLDKPILLLAASRGEGGGQRGLQQLRQLLANLKASCHEEAFPLPRAHEALDALGRLRDAAARERLTRLVTRFVEGVHGRAPVTA